MLDNFLEVITLLIRPFVKQIPFELAYRPPKGFQHGISKAVDLGRDTAIEFFQLWTESVKANVPENQLLVFDVRQGWSPLCQFLRVAQPDIPFPHLNDSSEILNRCTNGSVILEVAPNALSIHFRVRRGKIVGWTCIVGVPATLVILSWYLFHKLTR